MQIVIDFDETRVNSRVFVLQRRQIVAAALVVGVVVAAVSYVVAAQIARYWVTSGNEKVAIIALDAIKENDREKRQMWKDGIDSLQQDIADFNVRLIALNHRGVALADKLGLTTEEDVFAVDENLLCAAAADGEGDEEVDNADASGTDASGSAEISDEEVSKTLSRQSLMLAELEKKFALLSDQSARRAVAQEAIPMERPVLGKNWVASRYGYRRDPFTGRRAFHSGYDYAAKAGTPVIAAAAGVVIYAGRRGNYGKVIEVYHGGGVSSLYGHLSDYSVASWQYVRRGEVIGEVGSTGRSTGPHLHYELRINNRPRPVRKAIQDLQKSRRVS